MLNVLTSGKLVKDTELKTGQSGKPYCNFFLGVSIGEAENIVVSGVAFGEHAERITRLGRGDALAVVGSLKPTEWQDKATNETRRGLSVTVSNVLSVYDIKGKRKAETPENSTQQDRQDYSSNPKPFDDGLRF